VSPGALHILVVEEEVLHQRIAEALPRKQGHTAAIVASGEDALMAITGDNFDLIVMEVQMKGMDGIEATARIGDLEGQRVRYTPIIGMTTDPDCRARAQARGMAGTAARPVNAPPLAFMSAGV